MISEDYYKKSKRDIKYILKGYGLAKHYEDFTHDYFIIVLEGKAKHQTLSQFVIDNIRRITHRGKRMHELFGKRLRYIEK